MIGQLHQMKNRQELPNERILQLAPAAGQQAPIATASDKYTFVPTIQTVDILRDVGWLPVTAQQAAVRKEERSGFQKHVIRFVHKDRMINNAGEEIELVLINSHDLGCSFQLLAGIFRMVCANGLVLGTEHMSFRHKHIGFNPEKFIQSSRQIADNTGEISQEMDTLKAIDLTPDEQDIYAMASHQLIYGESEEEQEKAPILPEHLLTARRYQDRENKDLWTTFNKVQENAIKGGLKNYGKRKARRTRAVKSIDKDIKLNTALWTLTERMKELKLQDK